MMSKAKIKNIYNRIDRKILFFLNMKIDKSTTAKTALISMPDTSTLKMMNKKEILNLTKVYDVKNGFASSGSLSESAQAYDFVRRLYIHSRDNSLAFLRSLHRLFRGYSEK